METKMETIIVALVVICIVVSAGSLGYMMTTIGGLAGGLTDVADELAAVSSELGEVSGKADDILEELGKPVEKFICPYCGAEFATKTDLAAHIEEMHPPTVTLTVWGPWTGVELEPFTSVLEAFEEKTNIMTEYVHYRTEDAQAVLGIQFEAEQSAADLSTMDPYFIREKAKAGHILDLTAVIDESDFLPGSLDKYKVDGKIYGGPLSHKCIPGFFYRKSFFEEHNLTPPETWAEFIDLLDECKEIPGVKAPIATGDGAGWPLADMFEAFLIAGGGSKLHDDLIAGTAKWTDPEVKDAYEKTLIQLLRGGYYTEPVDWTTLLDLWWDGEFVLYFQGSWILGMVEDPEDLGLLPVPGTDGMVVFFDSIAIPAYTEHPEEAKELLSFLLSLEGQTILVQGGIGAMATNIHVPVEAYPSHVRGLAEATKDLKPLDILPFTIGGEFYIAFWDQAKLLWANPDALDEVLAALEEAAIEAREGT